MDDNFAISGFVRRRSYRIRQDCAGFSNGSRGMEGDQHVTSNSGISVDPPGSSYTSLSVKHAELIKAQFLLQATAQRYAGFAGPHDDDRNICVGVFVVSIDDMNGIGEMCHECVRDM